MKYIVRLYTNKEEDPNKYIEKILDNREAVYKVLRLKPTTFSKFLNGNLNFDKTKFSYLKNVSITKIKESQPYQKQELDIYDEILKDFNKL